MIIFGQFVTPIILIPPRALIDEETVRWIGRLFLRRRTAERA
jgi:hypothetical protein